MSLEKGDFWALLCLSLEFIHFSKIWTFFWLIVWCVGHFCMYFISDKDCFIRNFYRLFHWWNNNYYSNSKYGLDQKCPKSTTGFLNLFKFLEYVKHIQCFWFFGRKRFYTIFFASNFICQYEQFQFNILLTCTLQITKDIKFKSTSMRDIMPTLKHIKYSRW